MHRKTMALPRANPGYRSRGSARVQSSRCRSILQLYRDLIQLRRETPAFHSGGYEPLRARNDVLCYKRSSETEAFTVALNLTHEARALGDVEEGKLVISTFLD